MNYVKLVFALNKADDADILSALLSDLNCQGFEETENILMAFFYENEFDQSTVNESIQAFEYVYKKELIPHENWNAQWESNFEAIRINDEVGIRANFHPAFTNCKYDIVITPKMSFGTGHHKTTQMMLEYTCEVDFTNKAVLDFGCGTGVLAIFAAMKGAESIKGIDNDNWSVENATENCIKNNCPQIDICGQDIFTIDNTFDIILANINLNILLETLPQLKKILKPKGEIFLSGILFSDIQTISECFTGLGFKLVSQKRKKDWVALHIN